MTDLVPRDQRVDRATLERVIQRATELQTREREIGDYLTEAEVMQLGEEVGIPAKHLRAALLEEQANALVVRKPSSLAWLSGPRYVTAARTIAGEKDALEDQLHRWMSDGELLQVKRRHPDRIIWERKEGAFASLKRSFGLGGRKYVLAGARDVTTRVTPVDPGQCHVQLAADLSNTLSEYLWGAGLLVTGGAAITGVAFLIGVLAPVALIPAIASLPAGFATARSRRGQVERFHVALEQVLDRLQHGELDLHRRGAALDDTPLARIADEIRKSIGIYKVDK